MYLLNSTLIQAYVNADNGSPLSIEEFSAKNLQHTFYYFRLGNEGTLNGIAYDLSNKKSLGKLVLQPGDFAVVTTYETFQISTKIIGLFGQTSDLAKEGIQVLQSPFLDPGFNGKLKFGMVNLSKESVEYLAGKDIIGKVSFFDISDTYPVRVKKNSIIDKKFNDVEE